MMTERTLIFRIKKRQPLLLVHITRKGGLENKILTGDIEGRERNQKAASHLSDELM